MKTRIVTLFLFLPLIVNGQFIPLPSHNLWKRPVIVPVPANSDNVSAPVLLLNGTWSICMEPEVNFWETQPGCSNWQNITVPSSCEMSGFRIVPEKQFAYKTTFKIPADFAGSRIILRFEGVTGTAKTWINGNYIREHFGGFNIWNCDITDYVKAGEESVLTLGITESSKRTSSGFNTGGVIRSVKLFAVPQDYISRLNLETDFDENFKDATLKIWIGAEFNRSKALDVGLVLKDPSGKILKINPDIARLTPGEREVIIPVKVTKPEKWDAEHPNLYTLEASVFSRKKTVEKVIRKIGFREIEINDRKMLVNGKEVKLRGAGRFDSDPVTGKYLSPEESLKEVRMLKNANMNFVRPSCYPATEDYLDACDSIGLYVQSENAVTFAKGSQKDTAYTDIYMDQMAEMIEADRSHPSIIIWELANETAYGVNIRKTHEYARAEDPSRPVIYSWSQSVPPGEPLPYELFSYHYPDWNQDLGKSGVAVFNGKPARELPENMPVLHDEFAHGSAYYPSSLSRDPGMRNFWGESIKIFWEKMFTTEGCLGGSIWAVIDENATRSWVYEWGMIDLWRRERPEYWLMKKAYSPVRIDDKSIFRVNDSGKINIPVKNWFDHTNLSELNVKWNLGEEKGTMKGPDVCPHSSGVIVIAPSAVPAGKNLNIKFFDNSGRLIDEFLLPCEEKKTVIPAVNVPAPVITQTSKDIIVKGTDFEIIFEKSDGMISRGTFRGKELIKGGPVFNLTGGIPLKPWELKSISASSYENEAVIRLSGTNAPVEINFEIRIDGKGMINTSYTIDKFGVKPPVATKVPWNNQDGGGFEEVGITYILDKSIDYLSWKRDGLWSVYPEDHIGRNEGTALRHLPGEPWKLGTKPVRPWSLDEIDFSVYGKFDIGGRGTNDFRSMKEYIRSAKAGDSKSGVAIEILSDGKEAVRLEAMQDKSGWIDNDSTSISYSGRWMPAADTSEYFGTREYRSTTDGDFAELSFTGKGIAWIGTRGGLAGSAEVFIDGIKEPEPVSMSARGKTGSQMVLFSRTGLSEGNHRIKIVSHALAGGQAPSIPLDAFMVIDGNISKGDVRLVINNLWNHTKMGLGNYMKDPILIKDGFTGRVIFRFTTNDLK